MDERERETVIVEPEPRVERETTVIHTGDRGSGGAVAAVLVLLALAVLAFLFFGGYLQQAADEVDVNVNVEAPKVEVPDIDVNLPPPSEPADTNGQ
jgi:hypothetical protein